LVRITKPGGFIEIEVPDYLSPDAWGDPTHVRAFSRQSFIPHEDLGWPDVDIHEYTNLYNTKIFTNENCVAIKCIFKKKGGEGNE